MSNHASDRPIALGQRIAKLRSERGWTQSDLAEQLAASRVAVSHFEASLAFPSERTIVLMAGLFGIEPYDLVDDTDYPAAKAERLPMTAPRYTEVQFQLALLERDLAWLERAGAAHGDAVRAEWSQRLQQLLDAAWEQRARAQLHEALKKLAERTSAR